MIHCAILGFEIDQEIACGSSGNHPVCRKCQKKDQEKPGLILPSIQRKAKKRCECGKTFIPKSNRQKSCQVCSGRNRILKNREYQARFRKSHKDSLGVSI